MINMQLQTVLFWDFTLLATVIFQPSKHLSSESDSLLKGVVHFTHSAYHMQFGVLI